MGVEFKKSNLWDSLTLALLLSLLWALSGSDQGLGQTSPPDETNPTPATAPASKMAPPTVKASDANDDSQDDSEKPTTGNQNIDQIDDGNINPLNPAGDSLDKLIKLRINEIFWRAMLGDIPCLETQEACIKELQSLAVQNSRSLKAIDQRVQLVQQKIDEARRNNQTSINVGVFEPAVQALFRLEDIVKQNPDGTTTTRKKGFLDRALGIFTTLSGINEALSLIGVPLLKTCSGVGIAAQSRNIQITDLQVKVAEIEKQRGDLADKIKETVMLQVLEFDVIRKDFQVSQEIARREVIRHQLLKVDYRFSTDISTQSYIGNLNTLDKTKAESFRQWARLRIATLPAEDPDPRRR
jgi:hypothetical protein